MRGGPEVDSLFGGKGPASGADKVVGEAVANAGRTIETFPKNKNK